MIFKLSEHAHRDHNGFGLSISTPYEYYEHDADSQYNNLHILFLKHSFWFKIPMIIKPRAKWKKFSDGHIQPNGDDGYWNYDRKEYGFTTVYDSGIHVNYGVQTMCWDPKDPENSDHVKIFSYFWNWEHIRHDAYMTNGEFLCPGNHLREWSYKYFPKYTEKYDPLKREEVFTTLPPFYFPFDSEKARKWKYRDGTYDNFGPCNISAERIYKYVKYVDPYDGKVIDARINIEEREWIRGKWAWLRFVLKHVPKCRIVRREIEIEFLDEVGPKKGSWKGGTTGMGFDMLPNESIEDCWARFQRDGRA